LTIQGNPSKRNLFIIEDYAKWREFVKTIYEARDLDVCPIGLWSVHLMDVLVRNAREEAEGKERERGREMEREREREKAKQMEVGRLGGGSGSSGGAAQQAKAQRNNNGIDSKTNSDPNPEGNANTNTNAGVNLIDRASEKEGDKWTSASGHQYRWMTPAQAKNLHVRQNL
jgi:hypothetical protein